VPLVQQLKKINPKINIVAEQAQWASLGIDYLENGGADRVFAFRIMGAIRSFDKKQLISAADSTFSKTPANKQQVVFIENHDVPRFSYGVKGDIQKLKVGAALNLLIGGVPSIYYGQEIGMTGTSANLGPTDANEVPNRQAFEWYKSDEGKGMAYWYKNSEVGRKVNNDIPNDGVSLEEEQKDPNSLWNFYRAMISLRNSAPALSNGGYKTLGNNNEKVFSFERSAPAEKAVVAVNLSGIEQEAQITISAIHKVKQLYGGNSAELKNDGLLVKLPAYGVVVLKIE
jgi:glycosidase